jgi:hypothetical protein
VALYLSEVFRDEVEVCQCGAWDRLLMLPRNLEQPADAVNMLGGEREVPPES